MEDEVTLLIDADSLIYFVAHLETVEEAILRLDERVHNIMVANYTDKYVMFLTGKDCFRYDVAKSAPYKGNRKDRERPKWLKVITQYMVAKYNAVHYKGLEADDTVCYFKNIIPNSRICAIDKDVVNSTEGNHFNYGMAKIPDTMPQEWAFKGFITVTEDEALNALHTQMLTGDSGDNIPGIKGIGPAKAEKILNATTSKTEMEGILNKYMIAYGAMDGIARFAETFRLVYMLRNDEDMMREVGYIPELPEIQTYLAAGEIEDESITDEWA
jgi:hypothetical protein